MTDALLSRPVVPVASEDDVRATAAAAFHRIREAGGEPLLVHVVEKAGGGIDKASVEQRVEAAQELFAIANDLADAAGLDVETDVIYGTDVGTAIVETAVDRDASAIVFTSREGGRIWDILGGTVRDDIVTGSELPVVVLPRADGD